MELGLFDRALSERLAAHEGWSRVEWETWNTWLTHGFRGGGSADGGPDRNAGLEPVLVSSDGSLDGVHAVRVGDMVEQVQDGEPTPILAALMRLALGIATKPHGGLIYS
jgi:hypothetical protein